MSEIRNVSDRDLELELPGGRIILAEVGETVTVSDELVAGLLEQSDNWGEASALTRDELAAQLDDDGVGFPISAPRSELLAIASPPPSEPSTVTELKAALEALNVEIPAGARKSDLEELYAAALAAGEENQGDGEPSTETDGGGS